jgi:hypothetical protein
MAQRYQRTSPCVARDAKTRAAKRTQLPNVRQKNMKRPSPCPGGTARSVMPSVLSALTDRILERHANAATISKPSACRCLKSMRAACRPSP